MTSGAEVPNGPPAVVADRDLAVVLRDAWSIVRLPRLQEVVRRTILELRVLEPRDLLGHDLEVKEDRTAADPLAVALSACSEELRCESGIPGSVATHEAVWLEVRGHLAHQPEAWVSVFVEALEKYRQTASELVRAACAESPAEHPGSVVAASELPAE